MNKWLLLSAGGVAGTIARYLAATWVHAATGIDFPYGTMVVNLTACLAVGVLSGLVEHGAIGAQGRLLLVTGFCGAYSTFSTWMLESSALADQGQILRALLNLTGSVGLGFIFLRVGVLIGNAF